MSDLTKSQPEFTAAIRGYDRLQVDEYVERLHSLLAEAEQRAHTAEDDLEFSRHATVGPRVSQIFDLAVAESQELRQRVQKEAEELLAAAEENAERMRAAAQEDDAEMRSRTEQARKELMAEMERQREAARGQLLVLEERRMKLVDEMRRLHDALGNAAAIVQDDAVLETSEVAEGLEGSSAEPVDGEVDGELQREEETPPGTGAGGRARAA
jgi:cell division septum initiation protein DivIVA